MRPLYDINRDLQEVIKKLENPKVNVHDLDEDEVFSVQDYPSYGAVPYWDELSTSDYGNDWSKPTDKDGNVKEAEKPGARKGLKCNCEMVDLLKRGCSCGGD